MILLNITAKTNATKMLKTLNWSSLQEGTTTHLLSLAKIQEKEQPSYQAFGKVILSDSDTAARIGRPS